MAFDNLPSRRKKIENGILYPDIYNYEDIPKNLRVTIIRLTSRNLDEGYFTAIHRIICDEYGKHQLIKLDTHWSSYYKERCPNYGKDISQFFENFLPYQFDIALDLLYLFLSYLHKTDKQNVVQEINQRMLENGFGYQFENDTLIRIDSLPMHKNVVKPTLELLQDSRFENANAEYRQAFDDYNHRRYEEMFVNLCKSTETTIKIIFDINKFEPPKSSTLSSLIETLKNNNFLPNYSTESLNGLAKVLNTIGNIRNNNGGHGTGVEKRKIDQSFITYAMHSTASALLFLLQRQKEWESK